MSAIFSELGKLTELPILIFAGVFLFLGIAFGWFFRKGRIILGILAILIFLPLLQFMMAQDHWLMTIPFLLGMLVHLGKPIYRAITGESD